MATKIRVVFKSGHTEEFACKDFKVTKNHDKISALEWSSNIEPRIMQIDCSEIAAILEVKG